MGNEVIQIGNKIEMNIVKTRSLADTNKEREIYISQFLQWKDPKVALIAVPMWKGHLVPLQTGDVYELCFYTKNGLYQCRGEILRRGKTSNNIAIAEVRFISALEKKQRRQFYRMECIIPMNYSVLTEVQHDLYKEKKRCLSLEQKLQIEKRLESQEIEFEKATVLDISGGGIRFNSSVQLENGDILLLQPEFPETLKKKIPFLFGRVIFCRRIPNKEPAMYDNRVEFVEISSSEQEQIILYIFKEERGRRKRESELK